MYVHRSNRAEELVRVLADGEELRAGVLRAAWTLLGVVYAGGLLGYGSLLRAGSDGRGLVLFVAFTTWAGDIGAYYVGSRLGRRPLAPRISPKKSVEGALGGIAATVVVAVLGSVGIWPRVDVAKTAYLTVKLQYEHAPTGGAENRTQFAFFSEERTLTPEVKKK